MKGKKKNIKQQLKIYFKFQIDFKKKHFKDYKLTRVSLIYIFL